jgi:hypothetical protein
MEDFNTAKFAMSLRIRAAFEQAMRHAGGNAEKVTEIMVTKLESDEFLLSQVANESMRDVLRSVIREGLMVISAR